MKKVFKVPVIVTKSNDFGEVLYDAQGTGEYWDIMSDEYDTASGALEDLYNQLKPILQDDLSRFRGLFLSKDEDLVLEENQRLAYLEFELEV